MVSFPLFIGTYTREGGKGIYALQLDPSTGQLSSPVLGAETSNPTYLALSPDRRILYSVSESAALAEAFHVEADRTRLRPLSVPQRTGEPAPCHLSVDHTGRALVLVNYHTALIASLPIRNDGALEAPETLIQHQGSSINADRQSSAHPHSITISPDNRFALVCDLGLDKIFTYRLDPVAALLAPGEPPFTRAAPGSGPRHFAFSPDGSRAFVLTEMGATVTSYNYGPENGTLTPIDSQSTLPADYRGENKCAAVRVHPNGRFVYASNRGHDSVAVFSVDQSLGKLSLVEIVPCGGKSPRDITLSPDGKWLVAANQDSNTLTVLQVAEKTGRLTATTSTASVSMPVCVLFAS